MLAIFTLMLISVIGTTLILTAGTASAIKANYKSSMQSFYDAKAGLEEGRSRLWQFHTDANGSLDTINTNPGSPSKNCAFPTMLLNQVCYITNPDTAAGETSIDPTDASATSTYDSEYSNEFGPLSGAIIMQVPSGSALTSAHIVGPTYKWVRITPTTEKSSGIDVNGNGLLDSTSPLFYTPTGNQMVYNGVGMPSDGSTQVFTVTALAVTPSGGFSGTRLLQYRVAQNPNALVQTLSQGVSPTPSLTQIFPAPLTLVGNNPDDSWYQPSGSKNFYINGNDRSGANAGSCSLSPVGAVNGIGVTGPRNDLGSNIQNNRQNNYTGAGTASPNISDISGIIPANEQNVSGLQNLIQNVTTAATEVVQGPATSLPTYGSSSSPVVAVVHGDLTLTNVTGYGILVVTGKLTVTGTTGWRGVVLVVGQGILDGSATTGNEFDGAVVVAKTLDSSGNPLSSLGNPLVNWAGGSSSGFFYDSCWMNNAGAAFPYQVLSFREIQAQ